MMAIIKMSESLQFYFADEKNSSAVNQIIDSDSIPLGLTWNEVEQYNAAKVSSYVTQLDYWKLLKEVWEKTWGAALDGTMYQEVDPTYYEDEYSIDNVWDTDLFYKTIKYNDQLLHLLSCFSEDWSISNGFYILSKYDTCDISNILLLSDKWREPEDNERWTFNNLVTLRGKSEIDVEQLKRLSKEVICKLFNT